MKHLIILFSLILVSCGMEKPSEYKGQKRRSLIVIYKSSGYYNSFENNYFSVNNTNCETSSNVNACVEGALLVLSNNYYDICFIDPNINSARLSDALRNCGEVE